MMKNIEKLITLYQEIGLETPNEMQRVTYKKFDEDNNVMLLSPTGSGKTLAFLFPLLETINKNYSVVQIIILAPSRELAKQIDTVLQSIKSGVQSVCCYGGRPLSEDNNQIKSKQPQIIIGTPGRILDHIKKGTILTRFVETLVLDEFDKCLELGFQEEMEEIIKNLSAIKRRFLTSATATNEIPSFVGIPKVNDKQQFLKLNFLVQEKVPSRIEHQFLKIEGKDKLGDLALLLTQLRGAACIVFLNYRESAERVFNYLKDNKFNCQLFHGGLEQQIRERALFAFSSGASNVLVSTDLSSRGIDIKDLEYVIHYHLPQKEEVYIHRCGRTGRWESKGTSILLINEAEKVPEYLLEKSIPIELSVTQVKPFNSDWVTLYIGRGKKQKISKGDVLGFLCKKGGLNMSKIGLIEIRDNYCFVSVKRNVAKHAIDLMKNEKIKGQKTIISLAK